jgi:HJR/Mrr/RecB family endonuclease
MLSLPSRAFEELVAELFAARGFDVELTSATRDGGRDIIAVHETMGLRSRYLIECKRYAPQNRVGLAIVQRLFGVKMAENANKAIIATTSNFTRDAKSFAAQRVWDLDLKAYNDILQWVREYRQQR